MVNPSRMEVRVVEEYSAEDRLRLAGDQNDPSQTASYGLEWAPKTLHVLLVKSGITVAHAGLLERVVTVGDQLVKVAGIGGVLTRPDCRGKGFGQMAVQAAEELVLRQTDARFGLLFCRDVVRPWYERLGWLLLEEAVWIDQPAGTIRSPLPVMVKSFSQQGWPGGAVRLGGGPW
jgi:GNAT superfamily N-acetyltransferase